MTRATKANRAVIGRNPPGLPGSGHPGRGLAGVHNGIPRGRPDRVRVDRGMLPPRRSTPEVVGKGGVRVPVKARTADFASFRLGALARSARA